MHTGAFTDKEHKPTLAAIRRALKSRAGAWDELLSFIDGNYRLPGELIFYGKRCGWSMRFKKSGKALATLCPGRNALAVQVVLNPEQAEKALVAKLGRRTKRMIKDAHPYHDGRWLFIEVASDGDIRDIEAMLLIKARPKKK